MWWGTESDPGGSSGNNETETSNQEMRDLKEQSEEQQKLISQLKEMLRKTDSLAATASLEKAEKLTSTLSKMQNRAKRNKQRKSLNETKDDTGGDKIKPKIDTPGKEKVSLLKKQLEENRAKLAERDKHQKDIEDKVTQIRAQFDDTLNLSLNVTKEIKPPTSVPLKQFSAESTTEELICGINERDLQINELNNRIQQLQANVIDLEENVKEKDSVIEARTKAITLMSEDLSRRGKTTLDMLDETKEQMRLMQENFVKIELELKNENELLSQRLDEKESSCLELETQLIKLVETNRELTNENLSKFDSDLEKTIEKLQHELETKQTLIFQLEEKCKQFEDENHIKSLRVEELEEKINNDDTVNKLTKQLDEMNKSMIKLKAQNKSKMKELQKQLDTFKNSDDLNSELVKLNTENSKLKQQIVELEEEKGNLQLHLVDFDKDTSLNQQTILDQIKLDYNNLKVQYDENLQKIDEINKEKNQLIEELDQYRVQIEASNSRFADLSQKEVKTQMTHAQMEEELEQLKLANTDLLQQVQTISNENIALHERVEQLVNDKQELNTKIENLIQENMDLIDRLEKLSAEKVSSAESIEIVECLTQQEKMEIEEYNQKYSVPDTESISELEQHSELNDSVTKLTEESTELMEKIELFTLERKEVMDKMENLQEKVKILEHEKHLLEESVDDQVSNFKKLIDEQELEIKRLNNELEKSLEVCKELGIEKATIETELQTVQKENGSLKEEFENLEKANIEYTRTIELLESNLNQLKTELQSLTSDLINNSDEIKKYEVLVAQQSSLVNELNEKISNAEDLLTFKDKCLLEVEENRSKWKLDAEQKQIELQTVVEEFKQKYRALETKIQSNTDSLDEIRTLEIRCSDLDEKNKLQLDKMKKLAGNLKKKTQIETELKEQLELKNTEMNKLEMEITEISRELNQTNSEYEKLVQKVSSLQLQIENLETERDHLNNRNSNLSEALSNLEVDHEKLKNQFCNCQEELNLKVFKLNETICSLENELSRSNSLIDELKQQNDELLTEKQEFQIQNRTASENIHQLQQQLNVVETNTQKHIEELQSTITKLSSDLELSENEIKHLQSELKLIKQTKDNEIEKIEAESSEQYEEFSAEQQKYNQKIREFESENKFLSVQNDELILEVHRLKELFRQSEQAPTISNEANLELEELKNALLNSQSRYNELLERYRTIEDNYQQLTNENQFKIEQYNDLNDKCAKLLNENESINSLKEQLNDNKIMYEDLLKQFNNLQEKYQQLLTETNVNQMEALTENKFVVLESKPKQSLESIQRTQPSLQDFFGVDSNKSSGKELELTLEDKQIKYDELVQRYNDLEEKYQKLLTEIEDNKIYDQSNNLQIEELQLAIKNKNISYDQLLSQYNTLKEKYEVECPKVENKIVFEDFFGEKPHEQNNYEELLLRYNNLEEQYKKLLEENSYKVEQSRSSLQDIFKEQIDQDASEVEDMKQKIKILQFMLHNSEKSQDDIFAICQELLNEITRREHQTTQEKVIRIDNPTEILQNIEQDIIKDVEVTEQIQADSNPVVIAAERTEADQISIQQPVEETMVRTTAYKCYQTEEPVIIDDDNLWGSEEAILEEAHMQTNIQMEQKLQELEIEREKFIVEIQKLQQKCTKLVKKLKELKEKNDKLATKQSSFGDLDSAIEDAFKTQIKQLETQLKELKSERDQLVVERDGLLHRVESLVRSTESMNVLQQQQNVEIENLRIQNRTLVEQMEWGGEDDDKVEKSEIEDNNDAVQTQLNELNTKIKDLSVDNEELQAILEEQVQLRSTIESKLNTETDEKNQLKLELAEKETEISNLITQIDYLKQQLLQDKSSDANRLQTELSEKETEISNLITQIECLKYQIENDKLSSELKMRIDQLEFEKNVEIQKAHSKELEISNLMTQIDQLKGECNKNEQLTNDILQKQNEIVDLNQQISAILNDMNNLKMALENKQKEYEELANSYKDINEKYQLLTEINVNKCENSSKTSLQDFFGAKSDQVEELEIKLKDSTDSYNQLLNNYIEIEAKYHKLLTETETEKQSNESKTSLLDFFGAESKNSELKELETALNDYKRKYDELFTKFNEINEKYQQLLTETEVKTLENQPKISLQDFFGVQSNNSNVEKLEIMLNDSKINYQKLFDQYNVLDEKYQKLLTEIEIKQLDNESKTSNQDFFSVQSKKSDVEALETVIKDTNVKYEELLKNYNAMEENYQTLLSEKLKNESKTSLQDLFGVQSKNPIVDELEITRKHCEDLSQNYNLLEQNYQKLLSDKDILESRLLMEVNKLETDRNDIQAKYDELLNQYKLVETEYETVISQAGEFKQHLDQLTNENHQLKEREIQWKTYMDQREQELITTAEDAARKELSNLEERVKYYENEIDSMNLVIDTKETQIQQILSDSVEMKDRVVHLEAKFSEINDQNLLLMEERDTLKTKLDKIKQQLLDYEIQVQNLNIAIKVRDEEILQLKETVKVRDLDVENLRVQLQLKVDEINRLESYINEHISNEKYQLELDNLNVQLSSKIDECNGLETKIDELNYIINEDTKQMQDLKDIIEKQVLKIEELNSKKHVHFADDDSQLVTEHYYTETVSEDSEKEQMAVAAAAAPVDEVVDRSKLELALYMLHQRDVRCEELTVELMQLLEERDTLQLRLSNAIRMNEELRRKLSPKKSIDTATLPSSSNEMNVIQQQGEQVQHQTIQRSSDILMSAVGAELAKEAVEEDHSVSDDVNYLQNKISELHSVDYRRDVRLKDETQVRHFQQLSIMQKQRDLAMLPPEATARLVDADYTLTRESESASTVLLNWLWGRSTPKVNHL